MRLRKTVLTLMVLLNAGAAFAQDTDSIPGVRALLRPVSTHVPIGQPIWVSFVIANTSQEPITLTVPGTRPTIPSPEIGLPLLHVFSGQSGSGVVVTTESGRSWAQPMGFRAKSESPVLLLAPRSEVGTTLDLREFFPAFRGAGRYRIHWDPYHGAVHSNEIVITVAPRKDVVIVTDEGTMTIRLFYDNAPNHVENFVELAESGFYAGKTFHRLEPGYLLQGGCPRRDGTGIRLDGKRLSEEFNSRPHQKGSVSMALLEDDPDSASCQFFISNTRQKDWDGRYTVFGELVGDESFATLDRLMQTEIDEYARPIKTIYIRSTRLVNAPIR